MLIPAAQLARIVDGTIDVAFRRWRRPRVRVGTAMRTQVGVVEVTAVERTTLKAISADDLRRCGASSLDEVRGYLRPDGDLYRVARCSTAADARPKIGNMPDVGPGALGPG